MTIVDFDLRTPSPAGPSAASGRVFFQAVDRIEGAGYVVLPARTSVSLVAGVATATIEPGVYLFDEQVPGGERVFRIVPPVGPVNYSDLDAVDPVTLDPSAAPAPAWYAYTDALEAAAQDAADSSAAAQLAASGSATSAGTYATAAGNSATAAAGSATAAAGSATAAAGSATAAAGSAVTASGHVTAAAQQVTLATAQAGNATSAATTAAGSASAAIQYRDDAAGSAAGAESARTSMVVSGTVDGETGHLLLGRVAASPFDAGYVVGPPVSVTVGEVETGPETPGTPGPTGLTGPTGATGGITFGNLIGTSADWNTLTTDGVYRAVAAAGGNLPPGGSYGTLIVTGIESAGARIQQTFYPATSALGGRYVASRVFAVGAWQAWRVIPSQRVDQAAGRAIYTWDDVNAREQLTYGDTGTREVSTLRNANVSSGQIYYRRNGHLVTIYFTAVLYAAAGSGAVSFLDPGVLPGCIPPALHRAVVINANGDSPRLLEVALDGKVSIWNPTTTPYSGTITYPVTAAWPLTLAGTAVGVVPYL